MCLAIIIAFQLFYACMISYKTIRQLHSYGHMLLYNNNRDYLCCMQVFFDQLTIYGIKKTHFQDFRIILSDWHRPTGMYRYPVPADWLTGNDRYRLLPYCRSIYIFKPTFRAASASALSGSGRKKKEDTTNGSYF